MLEVINFQGLLSSDTIKFLNLLFVNTLFPINLISLISARSLYSKLYIMSTVLLLLS